MALFWGRLPSPACYMEWVSCAGPFFLQAFYDEVCGFSALAPPLAGVSPFLHKELSLDVVMSFHPVLRALLCSFRVSSPSRAVRPPSWAFAVFLRQLPSSSFASLCSTPLLSIVKMVLFFVALATAIPIGELQALSRCFSFVRGDACLSFVFTFVAKCKSLLVPSLAPSWLYLCLTLRLVSPYVLCFAQLVPSAFSWTGRPSCSVAPAVFLSLRTARLGLFLWRDSVPPPGGVHAAGAARLEVSPVRTHEFSGFSTSVAFLSNGRLLCFFSLCFLFFFVFCVSQPKKFRGVVLYGHMKCRGSWIPPEFLLALSGTLSLSSDL